MLSEDMALSSSTGLLGMFHHSPQNTLCSSMITKRRACQEQAREIAHVAQSAEHVLGKDGVAGSIPAVGSLDHSDALLKNGGSIGERKEEA